MDYQLVIGQILATGLSAAPGQRITYQDQVELSYAELGQRVGRLGSALSALGLGRGSVVAVMDYDSHRYLECFFAVPMLGATLHTVNVRLSPEQVLYTINHAEDDAILVHEDFLPLLLPLVPRFTRRVQLILLTDRGAAAPEGFAGEYEALLASGDPAHGFPDLEETTRATLFYTTGTTGDPKGVTYSHRQLVLHTLGVIACFAPVPGRGGIKRDDVYMPLTPLFHVHGWGFPLIATMLGMRQVYPGRYEPGKLLQLIARHGVSFSHCVPTVLAMVLNAPGAEAVPLAGWKVIVGGSALPEGLARVALGRGIDVHTGYGMSETGPILTVADMMATQDEGDTTAIRTATGKVAPLVQVRVVDPQMRDVARDGVATGEVVARAPWLTAGYLRDAARSDDLWRGGWMHTGDVGNLSPDGTLRITDRLKDVIKSGGEWISSLELESIVSAVPGVAEVAAVGIPDPQWGERAVVLVVAQPGAEALARAVHGAVEAAIAGGRLSKWAAPERVELVAAIPKTSVGKIDKKAIRAGLFPSG